MTQREALLDYLKQGGTLTVLEALQKFGCFALSQRMGELRRAGYPICSEMVPTTTGKKVARYYIAREAIAA